MKKARTSAAVGASLVLLSSIFYASYGIWTVLIGDVLGGYSASVIRSFFVVLIITPIAIITHKIQPINWAKNWKYIFGMILASFFIWGPLYYSIMHAGIGLALTINYVSIVIGMFIFGWLFAGEKITKEKILSAGLGMVGLAVVFLPKDSRLVWLALAAAVVSGIGSAAYMIIIKLVPYNTTQTTVVTWSTSLIGNAIMMLILKDPNNISGLGVKWIYIVLFAIVSIIASWTFARGIKYIDAGIAGILGLLEIVFGIAFGVILFNEHPTPLALLGAGVIILAAAIPYARISRS